MDDELGTRAELLWSLLLVQIVYDQLASKNTSIDFDAVAATYRNHPLLPRDAPVLANGKQAKQLYEELLQENQVDTATLDPLAQSVALAEPLYANFQDNLVSRMKDDTADFEAAYRRYEEENDVPRDERLKFDE